MQTTRFVEQIIIYLLIDTIGVISLIRFASPIIIISFWKTYENRILCFKSNDFRAPFTRKLIRFGVIWKYYSFKNVRMETLRFETTTTFVMFNLNLENRHKKITKINTSIFLQHKAIYYIHLSFFSFGVLDCYSWILIRCDEKKLFAPSLRREN